MFAMRPWLRFNSNYYVDYGTRIGIGSSNPSGPLDVRAGNNSYFYVDINGDFRVNGASDSQFGLFNDGAAGGSTAIIGQNVPRLTVLNTGNVGIGTSSPTSRLDVRGDIRLGANGDMIAPGGWERLRIIRGIIDFDGSAPSGCCFSVSHPSTGVYDISFVQSFSSLPSTVATSATTGGLCNVVPLSNSSVRIVVRNSTNTNVINGGFHFITTGEQ